MFSFFYHSKCGHFYRDFKTKKPAILKVRVDNRFFT